MHPIDPAIFRAYDVRGKALTQLTPEACGLIAHAFGTVLKERYGKGKNEYRPTVVVGRDARTHGPALEKSVIDGLVRAGCVVKHIGATPSPVNYFTICSQQFDGGIQVTASHNPKEDNGLKLQLRNAEAYAGEDLQDLHRRIEQRVFTSGQGTIEEFDAVKLYLDFLVQTFAGVGNGMRVVVDGGNGIAGPVYCQVLKRVGSELIEMYTEPDGTFPNHPADPSKHATLKELQEKVKEVHADCGFAFDGDGDRLGVVDDAGAIITADQTLLLLAQDHLQRHPGYPIIFTVSNSSLLESEVKNWGGRPVMCKVGHSHVEHAMREEGALLGGEQSGHFFCAEGYFGFDDACVAAMRILNILSSPRAESPLPPNNSQKKGSAPSGRGSPRKLSDMIATFPNVFQSPERRPHCSDDRKATIVAELTEHFAKNYPVNRLDGARIDFGSGAWAGIRYSNTSPALSICIEAQSPEKLKEIETIVLTEVKKYPEIDLTM